MTLPTVVSVLKWAMLPRRVRLCQYRNQCQRLRYTSFRKLQTTAVRLWRPTVGLSSGWNEQHGDWRYWWSKTIFLKNSSLITFAYNALAVSNLKRDELRNQLITQQCQGVAWRVEKSTRHSISCWYSECYAEMWRVMSFLRKYFLPTVCRCIFVLHALMPSFALWKVPFCRVKDGILQCKRPSFGGQNAASVRMNGKELYGKSTPHIKSGGVLLHYYRDCRYIVFCMSCVGHGACCCLLL